MSKPETIKIDDVSYVRADHAPTGSVAVVIAQRGWVFVGRIERVDENLTRLTNASVIRNWGTTKGLGEIALGGPTSKTVLDPAGTIEMHPVTVVATLSCVDSKWENHLK